MSFRPYGFDPRFRESLKYEDIIHNQLESLREIFNRNEMYEIMPGVNTLLRYITVEIQDGQYVAELRELEQEWEEEKAQIEESYQKALKMAHNGCPDLVASPSMKPGIDYWERKFMIANNLLERKNLGLKREVTHYDEPAT